MFEYSDEMIVFETDCCMGYKSYYGWDKQEGEQNDSVTKKENDD